MAKIMLVEDDNNLREIYEARLLAEGYEIISAHDGEEALALAVKEKPDLIISDVMMPKISGFDMLDILRSTPETKDTKVIMMTALSQVEDKTRADKLGADRYLVKSQVTLEDVARIARDVIDGKDSSALASTPAPTNTQTDAATSVTSTSANADAMTTSAQPAVPTPVPDPSAVAPTATSVQTASDELSQIENQVKDFVATQPSTPSEPVTAPDPTPDPAVAPTDDSKKVIQPINDLSAKTDLNKLVEEEEKKTATVDQSSPPASTPSNPPDPSSPAQPVKEGDDPNLIAL